MTIVADASPLISLAYINQFHILTELFSELRIPRSVFDEITIDDKPFAVELGVLCQPYIVDASNQLAVEAMIHSGLGRGEAEAITIALETNASTLLVDDLRARKAARTYNLHILGTAGLLLQAKRTNLVAEIRPLLEGLRRNGIRIGDKVYATVLKEAGEI